MTSASSTEPIEVHFQIAPPLRAATSLCIGIAVTFCVYGYQFGRGNHGVYLLDALRKTDPTLLRNDWFTTHTLQYHYIFTQISALLMRARLIEPAFAIVYAALILIFHLAWRGIVRQLGGNDGSYLLSVGLYYLSAAGTALGMYQFFQDSSLLPSNIANVALLCGIWLSLRGNVVMSGISFGIAGLFHLNHALIGIPLWTMLVLLPLHEPHRWNLPSRSEIIGTLLAIIPSAINLAIAAKSKLTLSNAMPLNEFVNLYVHLRHPHHYDPSTWPVGIWLAIMWTFIPAMLVLRGQIYRIYVFFLALVVLALIAAGFWYVSETLVQMSLYRFSIYLQLFGCMAAGLLIDRSIRWHRTSILFGAGICVVIILIGILRGPFFGMFRMPQDDADYLNLCEWVASNTPVDAVFLVPPDEESMRFKGHRAIVVNFKCVPQLSGELTEWDKRLSDVLDMRDLTELPHDYRQILPAIRQRYDRTSSGSLVAVARKYGARYIVTTHPLEGLDARRVNVGATGRYFLYDLEP